MPGIPNPSKLNFEISVLASMAASGGRSVPIRNTWHYRRASGAPVLSKPALVTIFSTTILVPLVAALNIRWVPSLILCRCIDDATDQATQTAFVTPGAIATDSYDSRGTVFMQFASGFRGRNYNGAKHFGPLSEVDTTGDILVAGLARWQAVATACAASMVDANANTWIPIVFSQVLSQIRTNPTSVTVVDVTSVRLNKTIGDMKKRRAGSSY